MAALMTGLAETGLTTAKFVRRRLSDGAWWSTAGTPAFEAYNAANIADYGIAATETGSTGVYTATDPADTVAGDYLLVKAAGVNLAVSDVANGVRWEGQVGVLPTAVQNATALLAAGDVDGFTVEETLKLCLAALAGILSGAATTTVVLRAADNSKARITATVDVSGNRSSVTLDAAG